MQIREAMDVATGLMRQDRWDESLKILNDGYDHMPANRSPATFLGPEDIAIEHKQQ